MDNIASHPVVRGTPVSARESAVGFRNDVDLLALSAQKFYEPLTSERLHRFWRAFDKQTLAREYSVLCLYAEFASRGWRQA